MVGGWGGSGLRGVESWIGGVWGVEMLGMAGGWGVERNLGPVGPRKIFGIWGSFRLCQRANSIWNSPSWSVETQKIFASGGSIFHVAFFPFAAAPEHF